MWMDARHSDIDFVIVQDLDEFLYFPEHPNDILAALEDYKKEGITAAICSGYNIICSDAEWDNAIIKIKETGVDVTTLIYNGYADTGYNKALIFNPKAINATNYSPGAHYWYPVGNIVYPKTAPYLLHYKYIGKEYCINRNKSIRGRTSEFNRTTGFGSHYQQSDDKVISMFNDIYSQPIVRII
jgi:hypothetical protein